MEEYGGATFHGIMMCNCSGVEYHVEEVWCWEGLRVRFSSLAHWFHDPIQRHDCSFKSKGLQVRITLCSVLEFIKLVTSV